MKSIHLPPHIAVTSVDHDVLDGDKTSTPSVDHDVLDGDSFRFVSFSCGWFSGSDSLERETRILDVIADVMFDFLLDERRRRLQVFIFTTSEA